jgi:hypothetical protein
MSTNRKESFTPKKAMRHFLAQASMRLKRPNALPLAPAGELVYFFGPDPQVMKDLLKHQEDLDFYV